MMTRTSQNSGFQSSGPVVGALKLGQAGDCGVEADGLADMTSFKAGFRPREPADRGSLHHRARLLQQPSSERSEPTQSHGEAS